MFFMYGYPVIIALFVEIILLSPVNCLSTFVENKFRLNGYL